MRGDRIAAVGSDAEIQAWVGPRTRVIDLRGRLAIPGFIDGHGHYTGLGESKLVLDLTKARTWDDIVVQVRDAAAAAKPGTLIEGRGWHQEKWTHAPAPNVEGVPLHASLDAVSARNPVVLEHASGHASFVNGAALRLAGVGRETPNPAGGEIVKDSTGEPTGLLKESSPSSRITCIRLARLYGAAQGLRWTEVPHLFATRSVRGEPIVVRGPDQLLDLLHIRDAVAALLRFTADGLNPTAESRRAATAPGTARSGRTRGG